MDYIAVINYGGNFNYNNLLYNIYLEVLSKAEVKSTKVTYNFLFYENY